MDMLLSSTHGSLRVNNPVSLMEPTRIQTRTGGNIKSHHWPRKGRTQSHTVQLNSRLYDVQYHMLPRVPPGAGLYAATSHSARTQHIAGIAMQLYIMCVVI